MIKNEEAVWMRPKIERKLTAFETGGKLLGLSLDLQIEIQYFNG